MLAFCHAKATCWQAYIALWMAGDEIISVWLVVKLAKLAQVMF